LRGEGTSYRQSLVRYKHWRRLVIHIRWANQNIGRGQKVVKSDKCMGVSQLLGAFARAAPHSIRLWPYYYKSLHL